MAAERGTSGHGSLEPSRLHTLNYGFKSARAAHVAAKVDIFTKLNKAGKGGCVVSDFALRSNRWLRGPAANVGHYCCNSAGLTRNQLVELLGLSPAAERGTRDWLDLLVALDLLQRQGSGEDATYSNSLEADAFMVKGAEGYIGGAFVLSHDRHSLLPTHPHAPQHVQQRQLSAHA